MIRNMTFLLCFMMVLRHYGFYSSQGIIQEFGLEQPLEQLILLPVTGLFGGLIHFQNYPVVKRYDWVFIKMLLLIVLVVLINNFDIKSIINYSIYTGSRRPRFLILIPIALSILFGRKSYIFLVLVPLYLYSMSFIIHYWLMFLIIGKISEENSRLFYVGMALSFAFALDWNRVNIIAETGLVILYLVGLKKVSGHIKISFPKISVLYFYFVQAVMFTFMPNYNLFGIVLILVMSYSFGYMFSKIESYSVNKFNLNRFNEGITRT